MIKVTAVDYLFRDRLDFVFEAENEGFCFQM